MREPCTIIILPTVRVNEEFRGPPDVDLARQALKPSSDRRNIIELWRVRLDREQAELVQPPCDV